MKSLLFLCLLPACVFAQDITGVWVGYIHNDSTSLDLHYEVAITSHKGRLSGYSYTNFIVDGKELTGVKTIKVSSKNEKIYFEDDDLIYNDYPFAPPKGVRQLSVFTLDAADVLNGKFITSRTRQYGRPVTGTIHLERKKDPEASKLVAVLGKINMTADLSFLEMPPKKDEVIASPPVASEIKPPPITTDNKEVAAASPEKNKEADAMVVAPVNERKKTPVNKSKKKDVAVNIPTVKPNAVITAGETKKPQPVPDLAKELEKRKVVPVETVFFTSDSLILELYDNGYVDGDSVSILLGGKPLLTHVRLTEKAARKTIHITPEMGDSVELVMFAENLGSIAPNSGLAILHDGKNQYRITFIGDLQRNAAIILRRKNKSTK